MLKRDSVMAQRLATICRWINRHRRGSVGRKLLARLGARLTLPGSSVEDALVGNGFRMTLRLDSYIDSTIYFYAFEHTTCEVLRQVLRPGGTFVDVGANIGFFSLMAARLVGPSGRVVAFEPNPKVRSRFESTTRRNGFEGIVDIRDCALGAARELGELFVPVSGDPGLASLRPALGPDELVACHVRIRRLDDEIDSASALDLLKIDVEGAELLVLQGGRCLLTGVRPHVICEANQKAARNFGYDPVDLVRFFLDDLGGYRVHALTSRKIIRNVPFPAAMVADPRLENWWFEPIPSRLAVQETARRSHGG